MIEIKIKPLSINKAYKGKRFMTNDYRLYKIKLNELLPKHIEIPQPPFFIHFIFGFSSRASDWDNCLKATQDCIATKYKFNDKLIRRGLVDIEIVKKGAEFFKFKIETLNK